MLSKRIGGSITVESEINKGSKFSLSIDIRHFFRIANRKQSESKKIDPDLVCSFHTNKFKEDHKIEKIQLYTEERLINNNVNIEAKCETKRRLFVNPLIIIADDEVGNRKVLASYLTKVSLSFEEAKNGQEAFEIVSRYFESGIMNEKEILIFMDSNMPVMNGEVASIKIRNFLQEKMCIAPKIICVTANADIQNKVSSDIYDDIIFKPLRFDTFKSIINKIVYI